MLDTIRDLIMNNTPWSFVIIGAAAVLIIGLILLLALGGKKKKKKARKVKKIIDKKCRLVDNKMEEIFTKGK